MIAGIKILCFLSVIPVRAEHKDQSEIVTQMLFGEVATIVDQHNQWIKINIAHDGYEGWVDEKQVVEISENAFSTISKIKNRQSDSLRLYKTPWGKINVLQGSPIISDRSSFLIDSYEFEWLDFKVQSEKTSNKDIIEISKGYVNAPYLWGGRTAYGIDCSGFTQTVLHQLGINLMRDASQQVKQGKEVKFKTAQPGDLAFFVSKKGNVIHVGILLEESKIIHAHGYVRIDDFTEEGIFNQDSNKLTHHLHSIRRFDL
ncbi:MAG: C40 family peptidase [Brumimicrobium sp.]